jgi:hypothetical protein
MVLNGVYFGSLPPDAFSHSCVNSCSSVCMCVCVCVRVCTYVLMYACMDSLHNYQLAGIYVDSDFMQK